MSRFGGGGDRGELTVGSLAGPVTPTPAPKTESEDQNDDAKIGRSAGRRSHKIRMIRCGGVSSLKEIWLSIGPPGIFLITFPEGDVHLPPKPSSFVGDNQPITVSPTS